MAATDQVSLDVQLGEIHAVIGPNGAGKTTLVSQLAGEVLPGSAGRSCWRARHHPAAGRTARAQRGLGRSYQITSVFPDMTFWTNVALAVQAHDGHSFRFWRPVSAGSGPGCAGPRGAAGSGRHGRIWPTNRASANLSAWRAAAAGDRHGPGRHTADVLLLDEPLAGMGTEESREMIAIISALRARTAILLVEHDMDAVFQLADRISVLVYGKLIATGAPDQIRADEHVRAAYLGEEDA